MMHDHRRTSPDTATSQGLAAAMQTPLVVAMVAEAFGIPPREILGRSRLRPVLRARRCCLYLLHTTCGMSLERLARHFAISRRTAALAVAAVEDWRERAHADALLERLESALRSVAIARAIHQRHLREDRDRQEETDRESRIAREGDQV